MTKGIRRIAVFTSTAALLGAGGIGAAQAATQGDDAGRTGNRPSAGQRGPSAAQLETLAQKLGVTTARLQAALDAVRPSRPTGEQESRRRDAMASDLATALGVDADAVAAILDANRPVPPATRPAPGTAPARPDQSKLVAALASGLKLDEAKVKAALDQIQSAHRAQHDARDAARYAALAKQLGLSTATVQAAFEAVRPERPAPPAA